ncbi:glutamate-1-semialdehyde 2,1-aminomutase [Thermostilla marina]
MHATSDRYRRSREVFRRACELMPGGVNSPARAFGAVGGDPVVIASAQGAYLTDVDGNRYIDYVASWGPMILGHNHPLIVDALRDALTRGTSYGAPTEAENTLAELVIEAVPSIEKVRLVNSGTEATMSAVRLARGYTSRDVIVKFAGCYHGHVDSLLVAAGSSAATLGVPNSPGVTTGTAKDTIVLPYNDPSAVEDCFRRMGDRIAAVIVEPVAGNMGCVPGTREFLTTLRNVTHDSGAVLIFDEVMSGFRVAYGGAQQLFGITPDLTTLGKIIGGGLPVGAYGGRKEIMDHVLPAGKVFQAGTLSGNPLAVAAGTAALRALRDENPYPRLDETAQRLADGFTQALAKTNTPGFVSRCGSMLTLFFSAAPVTDWQSASASNTKRFARFFHAMLDRGIYLPCSQFEAMFVSTCHGEEEISRTLAAAEESLTIAAAE